MSHEPVYDHSTYLRDILQRKQLDDRIRLALPYLRRIDKLVGFDSIAFCGMSGAISASVLAHRLGKTLILVRKTEDKHHSNCMVEGDFGAKKYIIVDDFISSGQTVSYITHAIENQEGISARCIGVFQISRTMPVEDSWPSRPCLVTADGAPVLLTPSLINFWFESEIGAVLRSSFVRENQRIQEGFVP